jgi:hypothetical protein
MKGDNRKSLRQRFNDRARRASAAVFASFALFSYTHVEAATSYAKTEAAIASPPVTAPPPYDFDIFDKNAPEVPPSVLLQSMTMQERRTYLMSRLCFGAGAKPGEEARQQELYDALEDLSKMTVMGKPLVDYAIENKVKVCALKTLPAGIAAQYLPSVGTVVVSHQDPREERALKMAHEILHAAQDGRALLGNGYTWDIESRVRRTLVTEAAAQAVELLIAFEAHVEGDDKYWKHVQSLGGTTYGDAKIYADMQKAYDDAIAAQKTRQQALAAAGGAAFTRVFESDSWRNFYLDRELDSYLSDITHQAFKDRPETVSAFTRSDIDFAGSLGAGASFTVGAPVPDMHDLISRNPKMAFSFQLLDIARHEQAFGADAPETVALYNKAVADKNPYLGLDLKELYAKTAAPVWSGAQKYKYMHEALDEMAAAKPQAVLEPRKAAPRRPPAPVWRDMSS